MDVVTLSAAKSDATDRFKLAGARPRIAFLGTSITEYGGGISNPLTGQTLFEAYRSRGYWVWAMMMLGWRFDFLGNYGVSGNTVAQLRARLNDVIAAGANIIVIEVGPNSTTTGVSAASQIEDVTWMIQRCVRAKVLPVVTTQTPVLADDATKDAVRDQVNAWLVHRAPLLGALVADFHKAVTGPSGGGTSDTWGAQLSTDNIHPAAPGAARMGYALAQVLMPLAQRFATPCLVQGNSRNYCTTGFGSTDASTTSEPGWPTQTVARTGGTYTLIRDPYSAAKWQQIACATGANSAQMYRDVVVATRDGFTAGEVLQFAVEFESDADWDGTTTLTGVTNSFGAEIQFYTSGNVLLGNRSYAIYKDSEQFGFNPRSGVLLTNPTTVPATTAYARILLSKYGGGTVRYRFPTLFKPASIPAL